MYYSGAILDRRDINQYHGKLEYGVNHSYRANGLSARFALSEAKEGILYLKHI